MSVTSRQTLNNKSVIGIGIALAILLPPGLVSFFLGILLAIVAGQFLPIYDPSTVVPSFLFFAIVCLIAEGAAAAVLFRRGASRHGWALATLAIANLLLGILLYQSTILCGFC